MQNIPFFVWILTGALVITYIIYMGLIAKRNQVREALSGIDVHLKQRLDLLPNILTIAKKFMEHEKSLLTEITELRTKVLQSFNSKDSDAIKNHLQSSGALDSKLNQLLVAVENYPQLKSDQTMVQAMQTYNEMESRIAAARRFYNSAVTALNNSVQIFPINILAKICGIAEMPFYEAPANAKEDINAAKFF